MVLNRPRYAARLPEVSAVALRAFSSKQGADAIAPESDRNSWRLNTLLQEERRAVTEPGPKSLRELARNRLRPARLLSVR